MSSSGVLIATFFFNENRYGVVLSNKIECSHLVGTEYLARQVGKLLLAQITYFRMFRGSKGMVNSTSSMTGQAGLV